MQSHSNANICTTNSKHTPPRPVGVEKLNPNLDPDTNSFSQTAKHDKTSVRGEGGLCCVKYAWSPTHFATKRKIHKESPKIPYKIGLVASWSRSETLSQGFRLKNNYTDLSLIFPPTTAKK